MKYKSLKLHPNIHKLAKAVAHNNDETLQTFVHKAILARIAKLEKTNG